MGSESEYRAIEWPMPALTNQLRGSDALCLRHTGAFRRLTRHAAKGIMTQRSYRTFLLDPRNSDRSFAIPAARILWAYRSGAMRYGLFAAQKVL